jgi:hypothetical protein
MNNFSDYQLLNAYYKHLTTYLRANLEILKEDNLLKIAAPADPQPVPTATSIKTGLISLPKRQKKRRKQDVPQPKNSPYTRYLQNPTDELPRPTPPGNARSLNCYTYVLFYIQSPHIQLFTSSPLYIYYFV